MQEIRRFTANDERGKRYTLVAYQEFAPSRRGDTQIPTVQSLRTSEGNYVNRLAKGFYELFYYGRIPLVSDDPNRL